MSDSELQEKAKQQAEEFMKRCDLNNDGKVEFTEVQSKFGANWSDSKIATEKARFESMDFNKDGGVSKEEFEKWIFQMMKEGM